MDATLPRFCTSSANSGGVQGVTGRPLSWGGSQATARIWVTCSAVNLAGQPRRGKSLSSPVMALGKAESFAQHSMRISRWQAAAQRRRQMPGA
jgi:hypothetical protein